MCDDGCCSRRSGRFHRGIPDLTGLSEVLLFRFEAAPGVVFSLHLFLPVSRWFRVRWLDRLDAAQAGFWKTRQEIFC